MGTLQLEIVGLAIALLATIGGYLRLWHNFQTAKSERSALEVELRRQIKFSRDERSAVEIELRGQIAKLEDRIQACEDRWHKLYQEFYTDGK